MKTSKKKIFTQLFILLLTVHSLFIFCSFTQKTDKTTTLIPLPSHYEVMKGSFKVDSAALFSGIKERGVTHKLDASLTELEFCFKQHYRSIVGKLYKNENDSRQWTYVGG